MGDRITEDGATNRRKISARPTPQTVLPPVFALGALTCNSNGFCHPQTERVDNARRWSSQQPLPEVSAEEEVRRRGLPLDCYPHRDILFEVLSVLIGVHFL